MEYLRPVWRLMRSSLLVDPPLVYNERLRIPLSNISKGCLIEGKNLPPQGILNREEFDPPTKLQLGHHTLLVVFGVIDAGDKVISPKVDPSFPSSCLIYDLRWYGGAGCVQRWTCTVRLSLRYSN